MGGKYGTKESKEILDLVKAVGVSIAVASKKDGWQKSDLLAFLKSPEVEAALKPAIDGAELVAAEVTEIDVMDGLALGLIAAGAYAALEFWLGKTPRTRAGSVLEAGLLLARALFCRGK